MSPEPRTSASPFAGSFGRFGPYAQRGAGSTANGGEDRGTMGGERKTPLLDASPNSGAKVFHDLVAKKQRGKSSYVKSGSMGGRAVFSLRLVSDVPPREGASNLPPFNCFASAPPFLLYAATGSCIVALVAGKPRSPPGTEEREPERDGTSSHDRHHTRSTRVSRRPRN